MRKKIIIIITYDPRDVVRRLVVVEVGRRKVALSSSMTMMTVVVVMSWQCSLTLTAT